MFMRLAVPVFTATLLVAGFAQAADRHVDIVNNTGMTMEHFYASTPKSDSWEDDILGRDVLENGETFTADIDDGTGACVFDFKASFKGGASLEKRNINVCKIEKFTYTR